MPDRRLVILCLLIAPLAGCSPRETFPNRPITFICPWGAGGGTDTIARQLALLLEQDLGVPVNVVNATGGGGVTGHSRGALARPDGYTMTMVTVELSMLHWRGLTGISHADFHPVMMVNRDAAALFVRADSPWQTLAQLEQAIRGEPGRLKASGTAFGGIWHVAVAGWLTRVGLGTSDVTWIAMAGSAPSLQELLAGGLDIVSCSLPEARVQLQAGKIRCLGVMADERVPAFPEVATFQEQGVDWTLATHRGIALPAGVDAARAQVIEEAVARVVTGPEFLAFMENTGSGAAAMSSQAYAAFMAATDTAFGQVFAGPVFRGIRHRFGPMFFPALLAGLLAIFLAACLTTGSLRGQGQQPLSRAGGWDTLALVSCVLFYVLVAEHLGFLLSGMVILLVLFRRTDARPIVALSTTLLLPCLVYQIFAIALRVPLPRGLWGW